MPPLPFRRLLGMLTLGVIGTVGCSSEPTGSDAGLGGDTMTSGGSATNSSALGGQGGATTDRGGSTVQGGNNATSHGATGSGMGGSNAASGGSSMTNPAGGTATGGSKAASGGFSMSNAAGGTATGGNATGGRASGGMSSTSVGGKSVGGNGAAGAAKGGNSNGGNAAGGTASGGARAGATSGGATGGTSASSNAAIKVWVAGDSTVQNCSSACPCGWGSQFDALFNSNVTVVNSAVGGRSIQTWLYEGNVSDSLGTNGECTLTSTAYNARWTAMTNATSGMKPGDYLFIQFGINDGDTKCPRHVGTALYKTYLATMAKAAKAAGAQPIFLTPTSAISCSGSNAVATRGFLTETKAAGSENDVPVIDLHQLSIALYNQLALCPNSADYTSTTSKVGLFFCEDHTHFEAAGAKQIAQVVAQALKDQGLGLAAYLL